MIEAILRQLRLGLRAGSARLARLRARRRALLMAGLGVAVLAGVALELRGSWLQSLLFSWRAAQMSHALGPGVSDRIAFPRGGPHDERLGYRRLPDYIETLQARGYVIEQQARMSPALLRHVADEGYAIYREKPLAGLRVSGRDGERLFERRFPGRAIADLDSVPPLIARTLAFIEDRALLDARSARRNPAVDWPRFSRAVAGQIGGLLNADWRQGGASTLATQIEKIRHWPGGRTRSAADKLRQMFGASLRSYLDGGDTRMARRRILTTYLDSLPLGARAGFGEVVGLGSGLWAWFGTDFDAAAAALDGDDSAAQTRQAQLYKQVLALLLATRRPAAYLGRDATALDALANRYLHALAGAGVIDEALSDAALAQPLRFVPQAPAADTDRSPEYKAAHHLRVQLLQTLGVDGLAALDRLDLAVEATVDVPAQRRVGAALRRLADADHARERGLVGRHLLGEQGLERVVWGIVLYERGADRNRLRLRIDSYGGPFDVNSGAKLVMGSSAKLRTLATYLGVVAELHGRLAPLDAAALRAAAASADRLTAWAAAHLLRAPDRSLQPMLDAAMQRRYSASPYETFFTGSGEHRFHNYRREEDGQSPTVEDAFQRSVNLVFVRLLRDVVDYYIERSGANAALRHAQGSAARQAYLARFADREGIEFLSRYYADYRGRTPEAVLQRLGARSVRASVPLTVAFRSLRPQAPPSALAAFLRTRLGSGVPAQLRIEELYARYDPQRLSLQDRAYLLGVHPLELWLAGYLQTHPQASYSEAMRASMQVRQQAYGWLFRTRHVARQDRRIRTVLEADAFRAIHEDWRRQGYPFAQLVPSLATALGSSGDRPDALADLVGIILSGGERLPDSAIDALHFARDTPYETRLRWSPPPGERVFAPEVAATLRRALQGVVDRGTAQRLRGAYRDADCRLLDAGGKTGTADERFKTFGAGGRVVHERHVGRTATFVFFLGDRHFGTVTAYVPGAVAADYHFTSSMVVQLLRALAPELQGLLGAPTHSGQTCGVLAGKQAATG